MCQTFPSRPQAPAGSLLTLAIGPNQDWDFEPFQPSSHDWNIQVSEKEKFKIFLRPVTSCLHFPQQAGRPPHHPASVAQEVKSDHGGGKCFGHQLCCVCALMLNADGTTDLRRL